MFPTRVSAYCTVATANAAPIIGPVYDGVVLHESSSN
jgi:hypothetical protein